MTILHYVGGPTALLQLGGVRLLTDPTFDPPGEYPVGGRRLVKTAGPAIPPAGLGPVDAVLLSHDQHPDNLDRAGRECAAAAPLVLSTASAAERLRGPVRGLPAWESYAVGPVRVTAVPALHGPPGTEHLTGEVTGFVLTGDGLPTVYVSGDNASLDVVRTIAARLGPVDIAVLFAGAAQTPLLGAAHLTLTSEHAAAAAAVLGAHDVVPLHFEHWGHVTQGADSLVAAFDAAGLGHRLRLPRPGEAVEL
ncbi:MBL fold metallo-hydrolase [Streptomyces sp. CMB-StM0423]|uniref:MBL fold metallo-hydrolase n=1 Tax=Streptomyces sp. CMB-StM0423 TaxID=2059884 RepID=UPI000C71384D|nr:MBL fold metallo-hydrolase [Streptomyces sp. CMB-StM0423]AUH39764.1 Zn-dependent hydrolase [Streptomyces sp. CMB-StM0423]